MTKCPHCGDTTITGTTSELGHFCRKCGCYVFFFRKADYVIKESIFTEIKPIYNCKYCSFLSYSKEEFESHLDAVHPITYQCLFCDKLEIKNKSESISHIIKEHPFEIKKRNDGIIPSPVILERYLTKTWECVECGETFDFEVGYKNHLREIC
ncbi:C2H2-type zinc finger protein [Methanococcoides alaskense]|uniref:Ribosomal protein L37AE/L43A n=1 Tax=Methanococcoides alaskense TaxID=325778 RepID=A0AA90Z6D3_9EURY|nr:C2H2-type zinc finger protein [Methanococcoides alaskense]MDA0525165.1 C2H2-type zinc finger protein [Methanococcoides alaskense]MDR6221914.1 ribosomal protein L37AE/L43A [Methanococcoides alaskense]